jgi:WD40 repeat protein
LALGGRRETIPSLTRFFAEESMFTKSFLKWCPVRRDTVASCAGSAVLVLIALVGCRKTEPTEAARAEPSSIPKPGQPKPTIPKPGEPKPSSTPKPGEPKVNTGSKAATPDWIERFTVEGGDGHKEGILAVHFSPDGATLASLSRDSEVKLWDTASGRLKRTINLKTQASGLAFSPDGTGLAVGSVGTAVTVLDPRTGEVSRSFQNPNAPAVVRINGGIRTLAYSHDGNTLAAGGDDQVVTLWDTATGAVRHTLKTGMYTVWCVTFSRDGKTVVAAGGGADAGKIVRWDVHTGAERDSVKEKEILYSVALSPDGALLASASGNEFKIRDAAKLTGLVTFRGDDWGTNTGADFVAFYADGTRLVAGNGDQFKGGTLKFYDVTSRRERGSFTSVHVPACVAISADGRLLAVGSRTGFPTDFSTADLKGTPPKLMLWEAAAKTAP